MIKPGFYRLSSEKYHASPGVSRSTLHTLLTKSPAHSKVEPKVTDALKDGRDVHCGIFEPLRFVEEYIILPDDCRPGTEDNPNPGMKARKKAFLVKAERNNQTVIDQETIDMIKAMAKAVRDHPEAALLLADGEAEKAGYWLDPDNSEILCKFKADWINPKGIFVDLKSTTDAREHAIVRDAYKYGWPMQAFFYLYGATQITKVAHHHFIFIVVEKDPPFGVRLFKATEEFINYGGKQIYQAMEIYKECLKTGNWPNYSQEVLPLDVPGWVTRKEGYGGAGELYG